MPTNKKIKGKAKSKKEISIEEILEAAENVVQEPQQAIALYTTSLMRMSPQDPRAITSLERRGEHLVSIGDQDMARLDFEEALKRFTSTMNPNDADDLERLASLHLYIGQLSAEKDALARCQDGIKALEKSLTLRIGETKPDMEIDEESVKAIIETKRQLSGACCSAAELYLTDLCFEADAESQCEAHVNYAMTFCDSDNRPFVDALQTYASLRLSQTDKRNEAVDSILAAYEKIQVACEELASLVGLDDMEDDNHAKELIHVAEAQALPGFEFRTQMAKILLECAVVAKMSSRQNAHSKCLQAAVNVLGSLLAENDEVVEIWMLIGDAFAALEQNDAAAQYWERAVEMLTAVKQSLDQELMEVDNDDEEDLLQQQLDEVICQLEDIKSKMAEKESQKDSMEQ